MKITKKNSLVLLIAYCMFFPGMIGTFGLAFEQILTVTLFVFTIIIICTSNVNLSKKQYMYILLFYFYFQISVIVSLLRSTDIIIVNDFVELAKPLYFLSFFILPFCFNFSYTDINKISKRIIIICYALVFWGILEAWTSIGKEITFFLYKPNRMILENKAVGPFIITYVFASFLVFPFFYSLIMTITRRNKLNYYILLSLVTLFCIFSTQSKTVFISLFVTLFIFIFLYVVYKKTFNKKRLILYSVILSVLFLLFLGVIGSIFKDKFNYIVDGLNVVFISLKEYGIMNAIHSIPSTQLRYEQFMFAVNHQNEIPLFGVGIGKGVFMPESLYAMYLYRFGILGIILHFILLFIFLKLSKKNADYFYSIGDKQLNAFFLAIHFYIISLPLSYFSSAVNDQTRTGFIFYILCGLTLYVNYRIRNNWGNHGININNNTNT